MKVADCTLEAAQEMVKSAPDVARQILETARDRGTQPAVTAMACAMALSAISINLGVSKETAFGMIEEAWEAAQEADALRERLRSAS